MIAKLLYDFALAEGDQRLAGLLIARTGTAASLRIPPRNEFAERAIERIGRKLGLIDGPG